MRRDSDPGHQLLLPPAELVSHICGLDHAGREVLERLPADIAAAVKPAWRPYRDLLRASTTPDGAVAGESTAQSSAANMDGPSDERP